MDFSITDEQLRLRAEVAGRAKAELASALVDDDREGRFDRGSWKTIADMGIFAAIVPTEYGGSGRDVMTAVLMLEGLGYGCPDNGLTLAINSQIWTVEEPLIRFGTEEQKQRYLPALCAGDLIAADAITEPGSGSDSYALETTAQRTDGGYVLSGVKAMIGMAPECDLALVYARTGPEAGRWGITAFLVEMGLEGIERGEVTSKMGLRTNPMGEIRFEGCWVPESARLGPEGAGAGVSDHSFEWERCFIFASHVGSMERQLEETVEYARKRRQFGKPIGQFQSVSNRIADMRLRLEVSKLLLHQAAWLKSTDHDSGLAAALTKLYVGEAFLASSLDAVRVHGGRGYLTESGIERDLRDSVGGVIYGGTSDIQRQIVARLLGL